MAFRYIGSKLRLAHAIVEQVGRPNHGRFVDVFCGTGAVAEVAARSGWPVHLNDHLKSATTIAAARLVSSRQAQFTSFGGYAGAVREMNAVKGRRGFVWSEYSPASAKHAGVERRYFSEGNARKIDGMRLALESWYAGGRLTETEHLVLLADLLGATNKVANTAGTYGCFMSRWQQQALQVIEILPRLMPIEAPPFTVTSLDATDVECRTEDVVYLDPPYTKRQYAAYYHILETIALGDAPDVTGVGGIRPWRDKASDYCYRTRAVGALRDLVAGIPSRRVLLSYSDEGHVPLDELESVLSPLGRVVVKPLMSIGRYRPNATASRRGSAVEEVLICIDRAAAGFEVAA